VTLSLETQATIRRLYFGEHWKRGTIAAQLGVHPDAVERAVGALGPAPRGRPRLHSVLDAYHPFIEETLAQYPRLRATRLFDMCRERGYRGSLQTLRRYVAKSRPVPKTEVFVRSEPLPGEQAQIDWGHVGYLDVPGGRRSLWVFAIVLSYSRLLWAELVFDLTVWSLRRSLLRAAEFFQGTTRQWLFDNPKTVVLERQGDLVRFHPGLLEITSALNVMPALCAVRKPNQKGAIERAIRYLKERFFAARTIHSIEHGNAQLLAFLETIANVRPHPTLPEQTVGEAYEDEKERLLRLPSSMPSAEQLVMAKVDKTASFRFDTNTYSLPPRCARSTVTVAASDTMVRVVDGDNTVAVHNRCWGRRQRVEDPEHRKAILAMKPGAADRKGRDFLRARLPRIDELFQHWLNDGRNIGSMTFRTARLVDLYGPELLNACIDELIERQSHDLGALAVLCERQRKKQPPVLPPVIGEHVVERDVLPHDLGDYDG
jgi:transposase